MRALWRGAVACGRAGLAAYSRWGGGMPFPVGGVSRRATAPLWGSGGLLVKKGGGDGGCPAPGHDTKALLKPDLFWTRLVNLLPTWPDGLAVSHTDLSAS